MEKLNTIQNYLLKEEKSKNFFLVTLILMTPLILSCSQNEVRSITMEESYSIEEGACGNIILNERLGEDFEEAVQKYETEKREFYLSFCPDGNPCSEIRLEFIDLEVFDSNGKSPEVTFKGIRILDSDSGNMLQSVGDAISSNGYHYTISWCPD